MNPPRALVGSLIAALFAAYLLTLFMSAAHLAQWFGRFNTNLPEWLALGLAVSLEITAFVLSLTSTALQGRISRWAQGGAIAALCLVWYGNGYAMWRAAPGEPWWSTVPATGFVGLTLILGKVLGDLFTLGSTADHEPDPVVEDVDTLPLEPVSDRRAQVLNLVTVRGTVTADEVAVYLGVSRSTARRVLTDLKREGLMESGPEGWARINRQPDA